MVQLVAGVVLLSAVVIPHPVFRVEQRSASYRVHVRLGREIHLFRTCPPDEQQKMYINALCVLMACRICTSHKSDTKARIIGVELCALVSPDPRTPGNFWRSGLKTIFWDGLVIT